MSDAVLHPRNFHVLLALVGGPSHGYAVVKTVEEQSEGRYSLDPANLYRSLDRMVKEGLIEEVDPDFPEPAGRKRRYYALTDQGREAVTAEVERMRHLTAVAHSKLASEGGL